MNRNEVERFIGTNTPDVVLNWLDNQATQEETLLAKHIMRQVINMADAPCNNLIENVTIFSGISVMGIS